MFTIRIHSVDRNHPLFPSLPSNSNPNPNSNFSERRGIIHLYRTLVSHPSTSHPSSLTVPSTLLFIVAVPNYFSSDDLFRFFGPHLTDVSDFLIIRNDGMEDRYSILIQTVNEVSAVAFYRAFNGKWFSPPEVEICHILYVVSSEFTEYAEMASTTPPGYTELPTCPICLERLDQDTSGLQSTLCDHSFQCSCISKWTYLSCQVCRLCQQQGDKPNCSVCDTSENLWVCIICGFVGCGRYKEGHTFRHWKDTQHCYSLDLETQRVWDYEGDNYVHRLNHSKADGKSAVVNSHCISHNGDCVACGDGGDPEITGALFNSKVEAIIDEYNHLLATQLENQRQHYEFLIMEAKSKREITIAEAVEQAFNTRMQDLQCKLEKYEEDKKTVLNMNHMLMKDQEEYKKKLKEVEERSNACLHLMLFFLNEHIRVPSLTLSFLPPTCPLDYDLLLYCARETSTLRSKDEQILDLEEQINDLTMYINAQRKFSGLADADDIKEGTVLLVPQIQSSPSNSKRRLKSGRRRN